MTLLTTEHLKILEPVTGAHKKINKEQQMNKISFFRCNAADITVVMLGKIVAMLGLGDVSFNNLIWPPIT